ncbi:MAG: hypothetical protein ACKO7B_12550, partial [Flavobacteriales bacterium]
MTSKIIFLVCALLATQFASAQKRYLVFANGYRGLDYRHYTTINEIYEVSPQGTMSPNGYWMKIDLELIKRFQPIIPLYID